MVHPTMELVKGVMGLQVFRIDHQLCSRSKSTEIASLIARVPLSFDS
jgi:hypothetical protein